MKNVKEEEPKRCTCSFDEETAKEIGHFIDCPKKDEKTWWQEEEKEIKRCPICLKDFVPDLEAKDFVTGEWDKHTYKFDCECHEDYKNLRVSIG